MVGDQINFRYMPALANGHLGFVPYRPYIHMKGLYSGRGGILFFFFSMFKEDNLFRIPRGICWIKDITWCILQVNLTEQSYQT